MLFGRLKQILSVPAVFETWQWIVGAPACQRRFVVDYVQARPGERVLDVGCGTGASLEFLPRPIDYTGIDISEAYIARAKQRFPAVGRFAVADASAADLDLGTTYDRAFAFGVLHHLSDAAIEKVIQNLWKWLKPGGAFVSIDPCFAQGQSLIAYLLIWADRGEHVRQPQEFYRLFKGRLDGSYSVATDMLRIPYTQVIMSLKKP